MRLGGQHDARRPSPRAPAQLGGLVYLQRRARAPRELEHFRLGQHQLVLADDHAPRRGHAGDRLRQRRAARERDVHRRRERGSKASERVGHLPRKRVHVVEHHDDPFGSAVAQVPGQGLELGLAPMPPERADVEARGALGRARHDVGQQQRRGGDVRIA